MGATGRVIYPSVTRGSAPGAGLLWTPLLVIGLAAFAVEIPFFFLGTPSGHDVAFHLYSWLEVLGQWRLGILLPRWAMQANAGCGEPRFLFYPPASWTLGAMLSAIFPWVAASSVYIWVVLTAAGASMFTLARRWLGRRDAIFAAVLYAVNPYHLIIVYWRSAFAELLASCLLPLLFLLLVKASEGERRVVAPLALVLAAAWLTNAPAAVMIHYSFALLVLFFAWRKRSVRVLLIGAGAVALGAGLAAFYLLPAIYEQRWVNIGGALGAGLRPQEGFLFTHTTDVDHDHFNLLVSWIAVAEMVATMALAGAAKMWRTKYRDAWYGLATWAAACSLVMFSITNLLWKLLPKLQFVQFPWRFFLCRSLFFSLFTAAGVSRWWGRAAICTAMLLVLLVAGKHYQPPWWDHAADLREMQDNMSDGTGYEGVDEYTPVGSDPSSLQPDTRKVRVEGEAHSAIRVLLWSPESKVFVAEMSAPDQLALRLFRYPAWRVAVNGHVVETTARDGTGQMLVPVEAGMNRVQINFERTWDRAAGGWISVGTMVGMLGWVLWGRRRMKKSAA